MLDNNHTRAYPPVYKGTLAQAMKERDVDAYLDSRKLNIDCKKAIEEAIALKFDGLHLEEDAARQVLEQFGEERMTFVMANTLRELSYDGRFSRQNKDWAEHIEIPENINQGKNLNQDYVIESHPAVLDGFIDMARAEIRMQKIEQALDEAEVTITADTRGFEADGHAGTWHTVDEREYGSARWGYIRSLVKKHSNKDFFENKLFTQKTRMDIHGKIKNVNLHTVVIGGSGAGKTRYYAKPNIMQCNTSYVVLDPKGEIIKSVGYMLEDEGYEIKVIDLIDMSKSLGYNPFHYIQSDKDVLKLITNLIRNTTPKGSSTNDPFWEKSETALLEALMLYLYHYAPEDEQNFTMVMEMLNYAEVKEDEDDYESPLDELFKRLETIDSNSLALKQYKIYKQAAGKTAKSILISVGVRLAAFNLEELASLTRYDEMELEQIGERKTALFAIIPDNDSTFNFVIGMLYTQLFQMLYYQADFVHGGQLPVPVHFIMDEFANVALPDEFDKLLSTMRSRLIFVSIILQNLAQIKALYKDTWESIMGNCDSKLYLGGNEQSTHEYISKELGKATIDTNTYGKSEGRSGSFTTNSQRTGRELLTSDEVRLLDNNYAVLFLKGERPVRDRKFNLLKHPRIKQTMDGGREPYIHGQVNHFIEDWQNILLSNNEYELLDVEETENYLKEIEEDEENKND